MRKLVQNLSDAERTVVVCGAGISTASGVPDFKTLYSADKHLFAALDRTRHHKHPRTLSRFLLGFAAEKRAPTEAHRFLARLEDSGQLLRCYTMNIDGMECFDDMDKVRFVHGRVDDPARCGRRRIDPKMLIHLAATNGLAEYSAKHACRLRPGFVMYGDAARHIDEMQRDLQKADFVLVLGSRMTVDPVAKIVREHRKKVLCVNNEPVHGLTTLVGDCNTICSKLLRSGSPSRPS